jgi:hypothetical protein
MKWNPGSDTPDYAALHPGYEFFATLKRSTSTPVAWMK